MLSSTLRLAMVVGWFVLSSGAFASGDKTPRPLVESGIDPLMKPGDWIQISCGGDASVSGKLKLHKSPSMLGEDRTHQYLLTGALKIHVKSGEDSLVNQIIELYEGSASLEMPNFEDLSYISMFKGHRNFNSPLFTTSEGFKGEIWLPGEKTPRSTNCKVTKIDPRLPRELVGSFVWKYPKIGIRELAFKADDEMSMDKTKYRVVGEDAAFEEVRPHIGKNVRITVRNSGSKTILLEAGVTKLEVIPVMCNISVTYQHRYSQGRNYGGSDGVSAKTVNYFSHFVPYSSTEEADKWTAYYCSYWNRFPSNTGVPQSIQTSSSDYKCTTVCK